MSDAEQVMPFAAAAVAPSAEVRLMDSIEAIPRSPDGRPLRDELRGRVSA
ncbi:hypothetical protein [Pseudonocardia thermophila]|jgi:hypothetical protein|nr:hypothetical protein [Pseudonocardia thermophila]